MLAIDWRDPANGESATRYGIDNTRIDEDGKLLPGQRADITFRMMEDSDGRFSSGRATLLVSRPSRIQFIARRCKISFSPSFGQRSNC